MKVGQQGDVCRRVVAFAVARNTLRVAAGVATLFITAGCGGSDSGTTSCTATPCDISQGSCQRAIFAATACEREQSGAHRPDVRTITLDQFRKDLEEEQTAPTENTRSWTIALALLGLLPAGQSVEGATTTTTADNVVAFYSPRTKDVTIIDRGATDQREDLFTLSHEFVHSLQDADVGLARFESKWTTSTDSSVALDSLIEGEATLLSAGVLARATGHTRDDTNWDGFESTIRDSIFQSIDESDAPFFAAVQGLAYPIGSAGLVDPWLAQGQAGIDGFYEQPRLSFVDWANDTPLGSTEVEPFDCYPTGAPEGYSGFDHDTLGIPAPMSIQMADGMNAARAYDASRAWRNDIVVVFQPDTGGDDRAVAWRTRWATTADAQNFASTARTVLLDASVELDDRDVTIRVATDATLVVAWDNNACGTKDDLPTAPHESGATMTTSSSRQERRYSVLRRSP